MDFSKGNDCMPCSDWCHVMHLRSISAAVYVYIMHFKSKLIYFVLQLMSKSRFFFCFVQVQCDLLCFCQRHNVTEQRNVGRKWEAGAPLYCYLPPPHGFTVHGLPPQLLVCSVHLLMGLAHTPVHYRAGHPQCHPGDSEGHQ